MFDRSQFGSIEEEIKEKHESMMRYPDEDILLLLEEVERRGGKMLKEEVSLLLKRLERMPGITSEHPSMRVYLSHPIRVTLLTLRTLDEIRRDYILISLLHNIFEVTSLRQSDLLEWGIENSITDKIMLLTIDRSRESDRKYLEGFYRKIEDCGIELSTIRCMDKIDNLLGVSVIEDDTVRRQYIELAHDFVGPMAQRISTEMHRFFCEVCESAKAASFSVDLKMGVDYLVKMEEGM